MATLSRPIHKGQSFIVKENTRLYKNIQQYFGYVPDFINLGYYSDSYTIEKEFICNNKGKKFVVMYDNRYFVVVSNDICRDVKWKDKTHNDDLELPFVISFLFAEKEWLLFQDKDVRLVDRMIELGDNNEEICQSKSWENVKQKWKDNKTLSFDSFYGSLASVYNLITSEPELFNNFKERNVLFNSVELLKKNETDNGRKSTADVYVYTGTKEDLFKTFSSGVSIDNYVKTEKNKILQISIKKDVSAMVGTMGGKMESFCDCSRSEITKKYWSLYNSGDYETIRKDLQKKVKEVSKLYSSILSFVGGVVDLDVSDDFNINRMRVCNLSTLELFEEFYKKVLTSNGNMSTLRRNEILAEIWTYVVFGGTRNSLIKLYGSDSDNINGKYELLGTYEEYYREKLRWSSGMSENSTSPFIVSCKPNGNSYFNLEMYIQKKQDGYVRVRTSPKDSDSPVSSFVMDSDADKRLKSLKRLQENNIEKVDIDIGKDEKREEYVCGYDRGYPCSDHGCEIRPVCEGLEVWSSGRFCETPPIHQERISEDTIGTEGLFQLDGCKGREFFRRQDRILSFIASDIWDGNIQESS